MQRQVPTVKARRLRRVVERRVLTPAPREKPMSYQDPRDYDGIDNAVAALGVGMVAVAVLAYFIEWALRYWGG